MSRKKIEQVRKTKYFRVWDLLVYGVVLALVVALFLVLFLTADKSPTSGFVVRQKDKVVFTYYFDSDRYEYSLTDGVVCVDEEDSSVLKFTVRTADGDGYNKIEVDKFNKSVKVTEANCSLLKKDCVYTPAIKDNSTTISCLPHEMYIEPLIKKLQNPDEIPVG